MSNHVRGKVEEFKKGEIKTTNKDGSPAKNPWWALFMKIEGKRYKLSYANGKFGTDIAIGDDVEFDYTMQTQTDLEGNDVFVNTIINDFGNEPGMKKFINHTKSGSFSAGNKAGTSTYKKDPEEALRIVAMNSIGNALIYLKETSDNYTDKILFDVAEKIEAWILDAPNRKKTVNFESNVKNVNQGATITPISDEIPF